jgi:hypothetical protein
MHEIWSVNIGGMILTRKSRSTRNSNLPQCQFAHNSSHMERNGIEHSGLCSERPANNLAWCMLLTFRILGVPSAFLRSFSETEIAKPVTNWSSFLKFCTNTLLLLAKFPSRHDVIFCDKQCQSSRLANIYGALCTVLESEARTLTLRHPDWLDWLIDRSIADQEIVGRNWLYV